MKAPQSYAIQHQKTSARLHRDLAEILLYQMRNKHIHNARIMHIKLSPDQSQMKVTLYLPSCHASELVMQQTMNAFQKAKSAIRYLLAKKVPLRRVPALHFRYANSVYDHLPLLEPSV